MSGVEVRFPPIPRRAPPESSAGVSPVGRYIAVLVSGLQAAGIVCAECDSRPRLSPHFYNENNALKWVSGTLSRNSSEPAQNI